MVEGWVRLDREIEGSIINSDAGLMHLYINLQLRANWRISYVHKQKVKIGQVVFGVARFAGELGISDSTLRRRLKVLADDGKIKVEATNKYTVVTVCDYMFYDPVAKEWRRADELTDDNTTDRTADRPDDAPTDQAIDRATDRPPDQSNGEQVTEPAANQRRTDDTHPNKKINKKLNTTSTPLPPAEGEAATDADWAVVVGELLKLGIAKAQTVCDETRKHGTTVDLVRACVAHWQTKQPAWNSGGLVYRLQRLRPGQDVTGADLWPPISTKQAERAKLDAKLAAERAETERRRIENEKHTAEVKALEDRYGPQLDALTAKQIRQLTHNVCGSAASFYLHGFDGKRADGMHREELLRSLAGEVTTTTMERA